MGGFVRKSFDKPDETRSMERGRADIVRLAESTAGRARLEPGWRWSTSVKPIVGGDSCQMHHVGYALAGSMHIVTADGEEHDINEGDAYEIMPGHDAWVTSSYAFEGLEFQSSTAEGFAKPE
jgi:hypothetical protein